MADWTVLVFGNAQNDLEPEIIHDVIELEQIGSSERVQVVAQLNRAQNRTEEDAPVLDGQWQGYRR